MDTQITGWKRAGVHRFSKEGYGRQRSWIREGAEEEGGHEPDKEDVYKRQDENRQLINKGRRTSDYDRETGIHDSVV